jgi:CPA2 family monovalent cation:H+ antiporter-2
MHETVNLQIVLILAVGFGFASILGYFSQILRFSPILGYLLAGYIIGPYSPGYTADLTIAEQLAEVGVILIMFTVGLQFDWHELYEASRISIPGALIQTIVTTGLVTYLATYLGWSIEAGAVFGMSIGVASTVVLGRLLTDNNLLNKPEGHIAMGWTIMEDVMTVAILLLLPILAITAEDKNNAFFDFAREFIFILLKLAAVIAVLFTIGTRIVKFILGKVLATKSHDLFGVTILAVVFCVAVGSSMLLGTSIALGAFIAGLVIGQTGLRDIASSQTTSIRDVFLVIFFLSIGMLFDPVTLTQYFIPFILLLGVILVVKPLISGLVVKVMGGSWKNAIIVGVALAQIGEFSLMLVEEANRVKLLPDPAYDIVVACAFVTISLNPLLFRITNNLLTGTRSR